MTPTRFLAGTCAVLFGITLLPALLLFNMQARLFESDVYKNALRSENLYQRMPTLLAQQINASLAPDAQQPAAFAYLGYLSVQDWESLITALVPPPQLQAVSEQSLDSLFDFINGRNDKPVISIKPIKQTLAANGTAAIERILATQPACTPQQLTDLSLRLLMGQPVEQDMLCNPPQELLSLALPLVSSVFNTEIAAIPDTIPMFTRDLTQVRSNLGQARLLMRLSPLLPLVFLALMTLLAVRSLLAWLRWWGIPLTVSAAISLLFALFAGPLTRLIILYAASRQDASTVLRLAATGLDVVLAVLRQITTPMAFEALFILLAGAGLLVGMWLVPGRSN